MEVIHWITGISEPATLGRGVVFDLRDFSSEWQSVEPDPDCELGCGAQRGESGTDAAALAPAGEPTPSRID
jgi:hypothetical protein